MSIMGTFQYSVMQLNGITPLLAHDVLAYGVYVVQSQVPFKRTGRDAFLPCRPHIWASQNKILSSPQAFSL
jgi:hypothetical protein